MNVLEILQIGGPTGVVVAILTILVKFYLDKRGEDRAEKATDRESESGIVETTNQALKIVREQMVTLGTDLATVRSENRVLQIRLDEKDIEIRSLRVRVETLEREKQVLARGHNYFNRVE